MEGGRDLYSGDKVRGGLCKCVSMCEGEEEGEEEEEEEEEEDDNTHTHTPLVLSPVRK